MIEAVHAVVSSHDWIEHAATDCSDDDVAEYDCRMNAGIMARYGFLTACIAVECGANALLESAPGVGKSLYEDLEKLGTLNKFELFALLRGNPLDRGCDIFGKMKEVWKLRNDFFHPKAKELEFVPGQPDRFVERSIGNRNYPTALDALEYVHAVALVG